MASVVPFGKYLLLGRIAQGGMAEVFLAKTFGAEGFERFVAIKRLLPSVMHNQEFVDMFVDEAKISAQLNHANIAQIYELGKIEGQLFIAMEFVHGKELRALHVRAKKLGRRLNQRFTAHLVAKAAEGLDYAHHRKDPMGKVLGIVHRDISPQNILLSYDGEAKVIDFGIAKAKDRISQTQVGVLKGKIGYMSPEQVSGLAIDSRSDIFSLGCVLYELITQERAFKGASEFSTFEKVRNAEYTPPSLYGVEMDPELDKIMRKVLARDRDERYSRGAELAADLQRWLLTTGAPMTNESVADEIRGLFQQEYISEMEKLGQYRQTKPPPELEDLLVDKQRRDQAEQQLEEHTVMISLAPKEMEAEDTITDRVEMEADARLHAADNGKTQLEPMMSPFAQGASNATQIADIGPPKSAPPRRPRDLSDSQELELEIRQAFKSTPPARSSPVVPLTKKKGDTNPGMSVAQINDTQGPTQMGTVRLVDTIDAVDDEGGGFTRGEVLLIVGASVFALAFVIAVYFYTRT